MDELRLVLAPRVYVLAATEMTPEGVHEYLVARGVPWGSDAEADPDRLAEVAGRVCYDSFKAPRPGGNAAYLGHIKEVGHGSVLEHASFSYLLDGVSRTLTHELVRHRAGCAYSQESQRYVDASGVAFVVPPAMLGWHAEWQRMKAGGQVTVRAARFDEWALRRWAEQGEYSRLAELLASEAPAELEGTERRKWARQAARSVLPGCANTRIVATFNGRALRHFLEMRGSRHAEAEVRRLAVAVWEATLGLAPGLLGDYEARPLPDGGRELVTPWRKV
jgi:thymidylate synthase (FAD)